MNRHQSNPFLSDWDDAPETKFVSNPFDTNTNITDQSDNETVSAYTRRSSASQSELGSHRPGLYRRNMSSFEAASLQLEQQQMQENGVALDALSKDLIAKMTADFRTLIENNDEQFQENLDGFNQFDPFETIVDDDVSLPSPAPSAHNSNNNNIISEANRPDQIDLQMSNQSQYNAHDSIDDDDEELVSTPVRNIKSSQPTCDTQESQEDPEKSFDRTIPQSNDSITKASMFASLLASAEASGQRTTDEMSVLEDCNQGASNGDDGTVSPSGQINNIETATHVIKGSPNSAGDGNVDRPVSFFDPFETVIDKDALTSLMNEGQFPEVTTIEAPNTEDVVASQVCDSPVQDVEDVELSVKDPSPDKNDLAHAATEEEEEADSKTKSRTINQADSSIATNRPSGRSIPINSGFVAPQVTPARRPVKQKQKQHKPSSNGSSSESSDDDDRIQIVIRDRDTSKKESGDRSAIVPLLPPPPSKSSIKQARGRGQVEDMPSPIMNYKKRIERKSSTETEEEEEEAVKRQEPKQDDLDHDTIAEPKGESNENDDGQFVIPMTQSDDDGDNYNKPDTPLYDEDTSYVLEDFPSKYDGSGWEMMLRYPPKKKLTSNRFWKKIFVKLAQVPLAPDGRSSKQQQDADGQTCMALQIFDKAEDRKPLQEIPIQATYTVSEISSQLFDQFGKIFTIKLQYIFYKERVGVRQGQLARFIHSGHIGSSTTSGGHGVDPISIGAIKRMGAPIEHSPQISQIVKLGCSSYDDVKQFKECLEDCLFRMPIHRDRALSTYKTEEVQMAVRDETYIELNQIGTITKQLARVRLFFLSFLNGMPTVEVGLNDIHRQGREVVGRMDILPVVTEEWIRLEAWELHPTVDMEEFDNPDSRIIKLTPPDATFFELMRFRVRPPRNRELPLQISANMTVTRTKVSINCEVMVPGCVSRKHGQIPCENIAIRIQIPECWIYFFREEKHFRMGSKKSVNRRPGKVKGIERFLGGGGLQDINDESSLIEVTSGQAKYEHHHHSIVWRAARWPKESQSAYVQNTMKIRLPLTAYDQMPDNFYEYIHVEYTMPATTVSHTTLRSISVNPYDDEPPEKYVKYSAKYDYKVKMRLSINLSARPGVSEPEASPIVIMKQPDLHGDLQREEDSDEDQSDEQSN